MGFSSDMSSRDIMSKGPAFCNDGTVVNSLGPSISDGKNTYTLVGTELYGPQGIVGHNVRSAEEARGIVIGMHGGRTF